VTAQDQAISTNNFKNTILKNETDSKNWLCKQNVGTLDRLNSGCPSQAKNECCINII